MERTIRHLARWGGTLACVLALVVAFALPAGARMAPEYQDSEPNDGASLATAPPTVRITFSEPLDDSSTMAVRNECGRRVDSGQVVVELNEMAVDITEGHYSGEYLVDYTAVGVGEVTGTTEGEFSFHVAEGHACGDNDRHKNHNDKDHDRNGHKDHDDGDDHDGHGGGTDHGMDHDGDDHGSGHVGTTHTMHGSSSGDMHSGHDSSGGGHGEHGDAKGEGNHGGHDGHDRGGSGTLASNPLPPLPADGKAVLLALALCAVMGVIGGVFLRASTQ